MTATMTKAERAELTSLTRRRFKLAKAAVDQRAAELVADLEEQLARQYSPDDEAWREAFKLAEAAVKAANATIREAFAETGQRAEFAPRVGLGWFDRGENGMAKRRTELRFVGRTRVDAQARAAKVELERREVEVLTRLTVDALTGSDAALAFLDDVPSVEMLMPGVDIGQLEAARP